MKNILNNLKEDLKQNSDLKTKAGGQRFFKERVKMYGVKTPIVIKIAKKYLKQLKNKSKKEIFNLCEKLWQSQNMEQTFIACFWAHSQHKQFQASDFKTFEKWIKKYINNWASCDTFCNHTIGDFLAMYPEYLKELKKWTKSKNRWVRRASAVSLIIPARKGLFLKDIFVIAKSLLKDKDDLVQKGYGWMLKVASEGHQKQVFNFVIKYKKEMPRTALRYAIEKMPKTLKQKAMKK